MVQKELLHTLCVIRKHHRLGRRDILAFQNRKLRYLIRHASTHVTYYRRLFEKAGIDAGDIRTVDDLTRLPVTDKNHLRNATLADILCRGAQPEKLIKRVTSGSSGRPIWVYRTRLEDYVTNFFHARTLAAFGVRVSDRIARVAAVIDEEKRDTFTTRLRQRLGIHRLYRVNCLQPPENIIRQLEAIDPDAIHGYAGALSHAAAHLNIKFNGKKLRVITCMGDALTPNRRHAITSAFGTRVFDVFNSHECKTIAWECPQTGLYHVCDDNIFAEVIRDEKHAREGEKGELVITALHAYTMPFIRYRLGDVVVKGPEQCPCGAPFSTFQKIEGRLREYFILPDGRRVHPLEAVLPVIMANAPWLNQYQMTQETNTRFVLRASVFRKPEAHELQALISIVTEKLGAGAEFFIELVDHIPCEPSGKFKDCRSLIQPEKE